MDSIAHVLCVPALLHPWPTSPHTDASEVPMPTTSDKDKAWIWHIGVSKLHIFLSAGSPPSAHRNQRAEARIQTPTRPPTWVTSLPPPPGAHRPEAGVRSLSLESNPSTPPEDTGFITTKPSASSLSFSFLQSDNDKC